MLSAAVAPTISSSGQPQSISVTTGQTITFSVVANGTGPLTYQWRKNGVNITCAAGVNCPSYSTVAVPSDNGAVYSVVVSNLAGSVTSASAMLTVSASAIAPSISTQPQGTAVASGQSATFTIAALGTAPLSYQWRRNGSNVSCGAGANCPSYSTPSTSSADNGAVDGVE